MMLQLLSVSLSQTFTVIGIPDTQNYSQSFPEIFRAQTQWVSEQQVARDIQFVSHYGDVVNCGDKLDQWANAKSALDLLDATDIPWGVSAGNHDIKPYCGGDDAYIPQFFAERYGPTKWEDEPYFLECSPSGMSNAQIFSAGGWDFLWLHLECDVPTREMVWAQSILDQHRDRVAVLTTHRYMQDAEDYTAGVPVVPSGRFPDIWYTFEGIYADGGNRAEDIFRWLVRRNPSICMVNCGHFHEEFRQISTNVNGLPVHEVLADYQDDPNGVMGGSASWSLTPNWKRSGSRVIRQPWISTARRTNRSARCPSPLVPMRFPAIVGSLRSKKASMATWAPKTRGSTKTNLTPATEVMTLENPMMTRPTPFSPTTRGKPFCDLMRCSVKMMPREKFHWVRSSPRPA